MIVVQLLSHVCLFATSWTARLLYPSLSPRVCSNSCPLSQWSYPTISFSCCLIFLLLSIFPSIRVFSNDLALHIKWLKYWSFSFSISPFNEYSGLISFKIDWFDLLVFKGLKGLLWHHSSKTSILQCSAIFMVQFSHPFMTTGKTIALTRWTFAGKVMSLLFICCVGLSACLPRASVFLFHGCSHHPKWCWSPRK